jgi:lysyl-tRNA synthetase, class I
MALDVPAPIKKVLAQYDARQEPFEIVDVAEALRRARGQIEKPSAEENKGAWAEVLAFALVGSHTDEGPWESYFGPFMTGERADGTPAYSPDIAGADAEVVALWCERADSLSHPLLRARYADLVWELGRKLTGVGFGREWALKAVDAYIAAASHADRDTMYALLDAHRALRLGIQVKDDGRTDAARSTMLALQGRAMSAGERPLYVYDALVQERRSGLTGSERQSLVSDLEDLLKSSGNPKGESFDPHTTAEVGERLVAHYQRQGMREEAIRVHRAVATTFERFASLGDAMLASAALQTSVDAYRAAGDRDDVERVRRVMAERVRQSRDQMTRHEQRVEVSAKDRDAFLAAVVEGSWPEAFVRIAIEFLSRRSELEKEVQEQKSNSPLLAMIPQTIVGDDHVVATVGSVDEDPYGRIVRQALWQIDFYTVWLSWAVRHAINVYSLEPENFVAWANRAGLFGDGTLLREGVTAWLGGDQTKAVHVLIPQVERALRDLIGRAGQPTTKPHPAFKSAQVAKGMGDIVYDKAAVAALGELGEDVALHLAALYADPRGMNLRNEFAHGLLPPSAMSEGTTLWLIHSLLLLGALAEPSEAEAAAGGTAV